MDFVSRIVPERIWRYANGDWRCAGRVSFRNKGTAETARIEVGFDGGQFPYILTRGISGPLYFSELELREAFEKSKETARFYENSRRLLAFLERARIAGSFEPASLLKEEPHSIFNDWVNCDIKTSDPGIIASAAFSLRTLQLKDGFNFSALSDDNRNFPVLAGCLNGCFSSESERESLSFILRHSRYRLEPEYRLRFALRKIK